MFKVYQANLAVDVKLIIDDRRIPLAFAVDGMRTPEEIKACAGVEEGDFDNWEVWLLSSKPHVDDLQITEPIMVKADQEFQVLPKAFGG